MKEPSKTILLVYSLSQLLTLGATYENPDGICESQACRDAAVRIRRMGDGSIDPCDDFYEFVCGGYIQSTQLYGSLADAKFAELQKKYTKTMTAILEQDSSINEPKYLKLARTLYRACGSEDYVMYKKLKSKGGWPVLEGSQWNESGFDITNIFEYFFSITHVSWGKIEVEPRASIFSANDYIEGRNNTYVNNYYNKMIKTVERMGAAENNINYKDDVDKILDFEIELGRTRLSTKDGFYYSDEPFTTLFDLKKKYLFFSNITEPLSLFRFEYNPNIYVHNIKYLEAFQKLFETKGMRRTLANYVMLKDAEYMLDHYVKKTIRPYCSTIVSALLPHAAAAIYVQSYNQSKLMETKNDILNMTSKIKDKFFETIKTTNWIDDESRNRVIQKFNSTTYLIGCIDELTNNSKIDEFYEKLSLFNYDSFDDAAAKLYQFTFQYQMMKEGWIFVVPFMLGKTTGHHRQSNSVYVSHLILLSDYFDSNLPNHINYAFLGTAIGHEIVHGYDNKESMYMKDNHLVDLWTTCSSGYFENKSKCLVDQYSNYMAEKTGSKVSGLAVLSKNIANLGGVRVAYQAYKELSISDNELSTSPYNTKQLFWINSAILYCEKKNSGVGDLSYVPGGFRVVGTLSNLPEFGQDFNCPIGSSMNRLSKCYIW